MAMDAPAAFEGLVGESAAMRALVADIERFARLPAPVVILGERGTGKELVARALHARSPRPIARFAALNCALLSRELLRSELFGHERGTFTGAVDRREGVLRETRGGTVFLDEVAELPPEAQAGLLRFLETGEVQPLGGRVTEVEVRVLAATNRPLARRAERGRFRADLYDRLAEFVVRVPPLRARLDDLPLLVEHYRRALNAKYQVAIDGVTTAALALLAAQPWPGNVRELRRVLGRAMVVRGAGWLRPEDLQREDGTPLLQTPVAPEPAAALSAPALSGRRQTAVWLARERGGVSSGALAAACGISEEVARRELVALAGLGHLRRVGGGRTSRYVLAEAAVAVLPPAGASRDPHTPPGPPRGRPLAGDPEL